MMDAESDIEKIMDILMMYDEIGGLKMIGRSIVNGTWDIMVVAVKIPAIRPIKIPRSVKAMFSP